MKHIILITMLRKVLFSLLFTILLVLSGYSQDTIDADFFDWKCTLKENKSEFVISRKRHLKTMTECAKTDINLRKKSILGFSGNIGGCEDPEFRITITRDDDAGKYIVDVDVIQNGLCKKLILYNKVFTTDKLKRGYSVEFNIKNILEDQSEI